MHRLNATWETGLRVSLGSGRIDGSMDNTPKPFGAVPSRRQLDWHRLETYCFVHFTVNTFTDLEWGYGDESPEVFSPSDFDADQIAEAAVAGGLSGLIVTAKHHDGFCLWPSRFTEHSIKNSPMAGRDVVGELSSACDSAGLKFGVYLSPWDRNHAEYARPEYVRYYRNQLRELLSEYGELFEVWFDGANGGDGFYGGARETRRIDAHTYYGWEETWAIVRELQPNACMFSDVGPDIRWVGNEKGIAGDPCWHTMDTDEFAPGDANSETLNSGIRFGRRWLPAECDVSIRPGWFYHESENDAVRSPENLMDLYYKSVGRGASLHLNLPPDPRGRIHESDLASLTAWNRRRRTTFDGDLAEGASVTASNTRKGSGGGRPFAAANVRDSNPSTYWATDDEVSEAELTLSFPAPREMNVVEIREHIALGQRVDGVTVEALVDGNWRSFGRCESVGYRRLLTGGVCTAAGVRLRIHGAAVPAIEHVAAYRDAQLS